MSCTLLEHFGKVFSNNLKINDIYILRLRDSTVCLKSKEKFSYLHKKTCKMSPWNVGLEDWKHLVFIPLEHWK